MIRRNLTLNPLSLLLAALAVCWLALLAVPAGAQEAGGTPDYFERSEPARSGRRARPAPRGPRKKPVAATKSEAPRQPAGPKLLAGDAVVPVVDPAAAVAVNVGLAKGGVAHIEFPASDTIYTINPGDENLVTIDRPQDGKMKPTDPITFRPGSEFVAPEAKGAPVPAAQITVQMSSGLLVAVNVYPVRDLSRSLTRLTVQYERPVVVAARKAKGLGTDLSGPSVAPQPPAPVASEPKRPPAADPSEVLYNPAAARLPAGMPRLVAAVQVAPGKPLLVAGKTPEQLTHSELTRVIESPSKNLSKFGTATHGLQLATSAAREVDASHKLLVFAVKNSAKADIRLTPGQPDVFVETTDGEGRPVNIEHLSKIRTETTAVERLVPAGGIVYYAVLFKSPVLGARQQLRISVSPMTAADEPATGTVPEIANQ